MKNELIGITPDYLRYTGNLSAKTIKKHGKTLKKVRKLTEYDVVWTDKHPKERKKAEKAIRYGLNSAFNKSFIG